MFSEYIESIFKNFANKYKFLISTIQINYVVLIGKEFDIVTSYDDREDELFIGFDLSKYNKLKNYSNELQFPVLLDSEVVCKIYNTLIPILEIDKNLNFEEQISIKYKRFEVLWNELIKHENYSDVLLNTLIEQRIEFKNLKDREAFNLILIKAHNLFKNHEYENTVELLMPFKERLNEYYKKILDYSLNKIKK